MARRYLVRVNDVDFVLENGWEEPTAKVRTRLILHAVNLYCTGMDGVDIGDKQPHYTVTIANTRDPKMTEQEWVEEHTRAPWDAAEMCHSILNNVPEGRLRDAAEQFLASEDHLEVILQSLDYEWG